MKIPRKLVERVRARAAHRCEYCRASEWLTGQYHTVDHILPRAQDGLTILDNLCLACAPCNAFKHDRTKAIDPESGGFATLFNPRTQDWRDHFAWSRDGLTIIGMTASGRATIAALRMNRSLAVAARTIWVSVNQHPPRD